MFHLLFRVFILFLRLLRKFHKALIFLSSLSCILQPHSSIPFNPFLYNFVFHSYSLRMASNHCHYRVMYLIIGEEVCNVIVDSILHWWLCGHLRISVGGSIDMGYTRYMFHYLLSLYSVIIFSIHYYVKVISKQLEKRYHHALPIVVM